MPDCGVGLLTCAPCCPPACHTMLLQMSSNWNGCEYQYVCDLIQTPNFSFQDYAKRENLTFDDLTNTMQPLFYASAVSCMSTGLMIAGGSNLAKFMYYKNVLSRREEVTAKRNGGDNASAIRRNALEKKVRQTRNRDILEVSGEMVHKGVTKLEEDALVMEFATGVPMEQHYDLVAHDDIMTEVQKAADRERLQGDAGKGLGDLSKTLGVDDGLDMELDVAKLQAAGGAIAAGGAGAAALKEANQLKQLQVDLQKITAKLETARATMEGRVPDVQGKLDALKDQAEDAQAQATSAVEEATAEAEDLQGQATAAVDDAKAHAESVQVQLRARADEANAKAAEAQAAVKKMRADMEEMGESEKQKMQVELEKAEAQAKTMQEQASSALTDAQTPTDAASGDVQAQAQEAVSSVPAIPAMPTAEEMQGMTKQQKKEAQKAGKEAQKKVSYPIETTVLRTQCLSTQLHTCT